LLTYNNPLTAMKLIAAGIEADAAQLRLYQSAGRCTVSGDETAKLRRRIWLGIIQYKLAAFFDLHFKAGYDPAQPRSSDGKWTNGSEKYPFGGLEQVNSRRPNNHHVVPKQVIASHPTLRPETRAVFETSLIRGIPPGNHTYIEAHRAYNRAVANEFDRFLNTNRLSASSLTPAQGAAFVSSLYNNPDARISGYLLHLHRSVIGSIVRRFPFRGRDLD
jgi:hypothetical protein